MTDFFDWLTVGDSGLGTDRLAAAFNLSHEEVRGTAEALAPAFTLALQRAMTDPYVWQELSRRFTPLLSHQIAPGPQTAGSATARDFSDALFGSPEISAAIARKVSLAKGIAPDTVEQLMRNLAVMTMQTMVQMMLANVARSRPDAIDAGSYPQAVAEMMRRGANAVEAFARPSNDPGNAQPTSPDALTTLFADALKGRMPFMPPVAGTPPPQPGTSGNTATNPGFTSPFEAMIDGFARGLASPTSDPSAATASERKLQPNEIPDTGTSATGPFGYQTPLSPPEGAAPNAGRGTSPFDELARAGWQLQDDYARQMMDLFGTGASPTDRARPAKD